MRVLLPLAALCAALMLASLLIGPAGAGWPKACKRCGRATARLGW
jgi:hypothetical protein